MKIIQKDAYPISFKNTCVNGELHDMNETFKNTEFR